jgi:hypothetical protein
VGDGSTRGAAVFALLVAATFLTLLVEPDSLFRPVR